MWPNADVNVALTPLCFIGQALSFNGRGRNDSAPGKGRPGAAKEKGVAKRVSRVIFVEPVSRSWSESE